MIAKDCQRLPKISPRSLYRYRITNVSLIGARGKQVRVKYKKISFKDLEFDQGDSFFERGLFGDVKRARWKGKIVAVKCFTTVDRKGGFSEELVNLSLLQTHQHIVTLYGASVSDHPFIVLEFAPLSLEKVLHTKGKQRYVYYVDHVMSWSRHLSLALEYMHTKDMLHRDVKPPNCLLFSGGRLLKLCDFGTTTKLEHTLTNAVGTILYMAPEVIRGRYYTTMCDVFSFGIVVWEMITRKKPFISNVKKDHNMAVLYAMANGSRPPVISNIPRAIKEMIFKCWDQEPQNRPTMFEIRTKLEKLCNFVNESRPLAKRKVQIERSEPGNSGNLFSEVDASTKLVDASTKLLAASEKGDVETMKRFLEIGYLGISNQVSVLMAASNSGHADCVALLLDYGIDVDMVNENGQSALMIASKQGHSELVQILLYHGAQSSLQDKDGMSSLMMASEKGNFETVQLLLEHGTLLGLQNNNGWTAVMLASYNNHIKVVETLLKCGGKVEKEFLVQLSPSKHNRILEVLQNQLDSDEIEQRHLAAVKQAINKQGELMHTTIHGVISGLARSGKDSLMKRLLGEMPTGKSPSTGVAEKAIQVRVEKSTSSTVSACVEDTKWIRLTLYDDEAIEMMTQLTSKQKSAKKVQKQPNTFGFSESTEKSPEGMVSVGARDFIPPGPVHKELSKSEVYSHKDIESQHFKPIPKPRKNVPPAHRSPLEIFKTALKTKKLQGLRQHLKNHWSIYLSNTGGQMEFQELLPLLVSGPSMFFVTFRLDRDLNERYEIEYEVAVESSGHGTPKKFKYTSSATPLETILQTLASIDAVGTYDYSQRQKKRSALTYKVFIVGTHRDVLEARIVDKQVVQQKIKEIDRTIFESVELVSYFRHIKFAAMDQLIFTVNNFSKNDDDFNVIRSSVQQVVDTGDFTTTSPSHWLIYSLVLRQLKSQIESYRRCFKIARDCGISDDEEHKEALHFIHTKMGVIRYFPIDELKQMVFLNPQILFDRVTEVIVETFTFEHAGYHSVNEFKKGIFYFGEFEMITHRKNPNSQLTPTCFVRLLEHLRIAAPFYQDGVLKYFFPCALYHADELQHQACQSYSHPVPPLVISFQCGYRPVGVAGALITYLMMNEGQYKTCKWILLTETIYRDQISFCVEPSCDTIVLKMFPTHLEVRCLPESDFNRDDCPVQDTCIEVCKLIKAGIERVNSDINYINDADPVFTFYCQVHCDSSAHPAKVVYSHDNKPRRLLCPRTKKPHDLPPGYENWQLQELFTSDTTNDNPHSQIPSSICVVETAIPTPKPRVHCTQCNTAHHATLFSQLSTYASKWRDIGTQLGFLQPELDNIHSAPRHQMAAPQSWLSAMLAEWLEWAPNDTRGNTQYATLEALKKAVSKAGLGKTSGSLSISQ